MSTITVLGQTVASTRQIPGFIRRCWNAFQERRRLAQIRAALYSLNDGDLKDMGISHGDIEYVASNRAVDPRGARSAG